MIRTLVFDLGGVIMDHNIPLCIRKFEHILGDKIALLGLNPAADLQADSRRLQEALSCAAPSADHPSTIRSLRANYELGLISTADFVSAILSIARPGFTPDDVCDAWDAMHAGIPAYRFSLLREWHLNHPMYALSNNNEEHWLDIHRTYPDFDSYFDACFASHLVHISKPDPRIFRLADARIAADFASRGETYHREQTIFVDDIESNRRAARDFGWQTCASVEELLSLLDSQGQGQG